MFALWEHLTEVHTVLLEVPVTERVHDHQRGEEELHTYTHDNEYGRRICFDMHERLSQTVSSDFVALKGWQLQRVV